MEKQRRDNLNKLKKMNLQLTMGPEGSLLAQIRISYVL